MDFLRLLAEHRSPAATALFQAFTWLGEELFVVAVLCLLYWCVHKGLAYRLCLVYFVSGIAVQVLKITFRIDRPWVIDPDFLPVRSAMATATGYSFPSGHTQAATALFGSLLFLAAGRHWNRRRDKAAACFLCAAAIAAVGLSRMYLGVHTPKDVMVSFAVSIVPAAAVCGRRRSADSVGGGRLCAADGRGKPADCTGGKNLRNAEHGGEWTGGRGKAETSGGRSLRDKGRSGAWTETGFGEDLQESRRRLFAVIFAAAGLLAAGYALFLCGAGRIKPELASDCVKAGGAGIGFAAGWYLETGRIRFSCRCRSAGGLILCFLAGIAGTLVFKSGLKFLLGTGMPADAIRYFMAVFWITALYPAILRRAKPAKSGS